MEINSEEDARERFKSDRAAKRFSKAGRYAGQPRAPMQWQATVGDMIHAGATVHATCSTCRLWRPVDLMAVATRRGLNFSLWEKRSPCPTRDAEGRRCKGYVFFHAALGAGTPSRPLRS